MTSLSSQAAQTLQPPPHCRFLITLCKLPPHSRLSKISPLVPNGPQAERMNGVRHPEPVCPSLRPESHYGASRRSASQPASPASPDPGTFMRSRFLDNLVLRSDAMLDTLSEASRCTALAHGHERSKTSQ